MVPVSLLAAVLAVSPAAEREAVAWDVPLECPGEDWLASRIEAYLGRPLSAVDRDDAALRGFAGHVRARAGGFELELALGDQHHRIHDHDCRRLADVAASLLAIAVDPLAVGGAPVVALDQATAQLAEPEPAIPVSQPEGVVAPVESISVAPRRPEGPPEPVTWELAPAAAPSEVDEPRRPPGHLRGLVVADVGFGFGVFDNVAAQVHAGLGLERHLPNRRTGLRVELEGGAALAGRFRAADGRELGGDLLAWDLVARPCAVARWGRVDLRGCASVGAGQLRGRGVGVQNPQTVAQPWVWAGLDLGVALALRRKHAQPRVGAALFVDLGAGLNALRPNFVVLDAAGGSAVEYVMPLAGLRGRLGVELRFF